MKRLAEISWTEAEKLRDLQPVVLVPVGAVEAHGPHLPLGTDSILSEELAVRVAVALEAKGRTVLIAPGLVYSVAEYAAAFAGTVSLTPATATAYVAEVCLGLARQGFSRVALVNNHLEPAHVTTLRAAVERVGAESGLAVAFPDQTERRWARTLTDEYKRGACHAGSYETSLVLVARPDLVDDSARAGLAPVPIDLARAMRDGKRTFEEAGAPRAYFGDPAAATVAEGEAIYGLLVAMVLTTIEETWPP
jgi:creatinine amidohydrolase